MPSCQHLQRTYCTPAIVYDCAFFFRWVFSTWCFRKVLETVLCNNYTFHHYDSYGCSPHHHAYHHHCKSSEFQLLIDFVRRGNHIAWGSRSSTLLHSFTHELGYQHQDHKILVIFHLVGLFCHHYQISPFLPLTVDNSRACCPKTSSQPLWPAHILPPASVVQLKLEPRHNWCLVWFRTSHKTDLPCTLSEVDQFIAFTLIACQNLWNETWWNLWIQMAHKYTYLVISPTLKRPEIIIYLDREPHGSRFQNWFQTI